MWGYETFSDLPTQDQTDIDTYINAALFDCYVPVDGTKPFYPEKHHPAIILAPVSTTLTLTAGSATVVGYAFNATYIGSFVKIGEKFYRYASTSALLNVWDGDSGDYAATVYHNAIVLPWNIVRLAGIPNLLGVGLLGPLPDPDFELRLRTEPAWDFYPTNGRQPFATTRNAFRQSAYYDVGDPRYYFIDQASVAPTFALGNRFHVWPLPESKYSLEVRANTIPSAVTTGTDVPDVPGQAVDNILLPIAREKLAMNTTGRRYSGNVQLLMKAAEDARNQLKSMRRVQKDTGCAVRLPRNW
jgi:hypothetical protein